MKDIKDELSKIEDKSEFLIKEVTKFELLLIEIEIEFEIECIILVEKEKEDDFVELWIEVEDKKELYNEVGDKEEEACKKVEELNKKEEDIG